MVDKEINKSTIGLPQYVSLEVNNNDSSSTKRIKLYGQMREKISKGRERLNACLSTQCQEQDKKFLDHISSSHQDMLNNKANVLKQDLPQKKTIESIKKIDKEFYTNLVKWNKEFDDRTKCITDKCYDELLSFASHCLKTVTKYYNARGSKMQDEEKESLGRAIYLLEQISKSDQKLKNKGNNSNNNNAKSKQTSTKKVKEIMRMTREEREREKEKNRKKEKRKKEKKQKEKEKILREQHNLLNKALFNIEMSMPVL